MGVSAQIRCWKQRECEEEVAIMGNRHVFQLSEEPIVGKIQLGNVMHLFALTDLAEVLKSK